MFGYGDLEILTASESGDLAAPKMLRDADDFKRAMLEAKHELELELSGSRPMPSPPLRPSAGSAVRAGGPASPSDRRRHVAGPGRRAAAAPPPAPASAAPAR